MSIIDVMVIFFSIHLVISPLIITQAAAEGVPFSKYRDLLTKNFSKRWLLHMSERQSTTNPYCNLCCLNITENGVLKDCGYHTLCIYKKGEPRSHCRGFMAVKFTEGEKYMILDAHNTIRNRVASGEENRGTKGPQPRAANMRRLEWDEELTRIAEMWVSRCSIMHDRCRDVERFPVGQNIAADYAAKSNHLGFIKKWYDEVTLLNKASISSYLSGLQESVGRYTQLVWAESYRLGCARAVFQSHRGPDVVYKEILVCNYGPAGNIPGQPVYIPGTPCSACAAGTECEAEYPALCGRGRHLTETEKMAENLTAENVMSETGDINRNTPYEDLDSIKEKKNYNGGISDYCFTSQFYSSISVLILYLAFNL